MNTLSAARFDRRRFLAGGLALGAALLLSPGTAQALPRADAVAQGSSDDSRKLGGLSVQCRTKRIFPALARTGNQGLRHLARTWHRACPLLSPGTRLSDRSHHRKQPLLHRPPRHPPPVHARSPEAQYAPAPSDPPLGGTQGLHHVAILSCLAAGPGPVGRPHTGNDQSGASRRTCRGCAGQPVRRRTQGLCGRTCTDPPDGTSCGRFHRKPDRQIIMPRAHDSRQACLSLPATQGGIDRLPVRPALYTPSSMRARSPHRQGDHLPELGKAPCRLLPGSRAPAKDGCRWGRLTWTPFRALQ